MPELIDRSRAEALIQEQLINTIFQDAPKQSVVMSLARKLPNMTSKQTRYPRAGYAAHGLLGGRRHRFQADQPAGLG